MLIAVTGVIFFIVGQAWDSFRDPVSYPPVIAAVEPLGTSVVYVNAVLIPATGTATSIPTAKPTNAPTVDMRLNDCGRGNVRPGDICLQPPAPTPTEAPLPNCPTEPGHWCVVPPNNETTGREVTE